MKIKKSSTPRHSKKDGVGDAIDRAMANDPRQPNNLPAFAADPPQPVEAPVCVLGYRRSTASVLFPIMPVEEFEALKGDIQAHGLREAILAKSDEVVDGWHRLRACAELDIEPRFEQIAGDADALAMSISLNLHRRQLSSAARAFAAARLSLLAPENFQSMGDPALAQVPTVAQAAKMFVVSERSVRSARRVLESGDQALIDAAVAEDVAVYSAADIAKKQDAAERQMALDVALNRDAEAGDRKATTTVLRRLAKRKMDQPSDDAMPFESDAAARAIDTLCERLERAAAMLLKALEYSPELESAGAEALQRRVESAMRPLTRKLKATVK